MPIALIVSPVREASRVRRSVKSARVDAMTSGKPSRHSGEKRTARRRAKEPSGEPAVADDTGEIALATPSTPGNPVARDSTHSLELPAECTARNAAELKAAMLDQVGTPAPVNIAVGAVERIDTSCLQLLVAFVRERDRNNLPVAWHGSSRSFSDAAALLGLTALLGTPGAV